MIPCDEILSVMHVSTKMTNAIETNVTKICHSKKVRYKIDFCSLISDHITIDNYYYLLLLCKKIGQNKETLMH